MEFTPWSAIVGGVLIGIAATLLLFLNGRIAGVSGVIGGLFSSAASETTWRLTFLIGLIVGAGIYVLRDSDASIGFDVGWPIFVLAGLLTGIGTQFSAGCTSGHGVCGIARFSLRSITATITFLAFGGLTVFVTRHIIGWGV